MNKISTLALAGLMGVSAVASASVSRWNGFGAANAYIADVQDIWTLPGVVASNKNAMYIEFGAPANQTPAGNPNVSGGLSNNTTMAWGGVHTEVGPGVLGVWVNRGANGMIKGLYSSLTNVNTSTGAAIVGNIDGLTGNTDQTTADTANVGEINGAELYAAQGAKQGRVDLFYGFSLSETVDLGVLISLANKGVKLENPVASTTNTLAGSALGFGIGAELKEIAVFKLVEVGLIVDTDSTNLSTKGTTEDKYNTSASLFALRVGGDIDGGEGKFGRVELGFASGSASFKQELATAAPVGSKEDKISGAKWNLGYAAGKSGEKGLGLIGIMLNSEGSSSETDAANTKVENSEMNLVLTTAGEAKIKEWLTARAGLASKVYDSKSKKTPNGTQVNTLTSSNNGAATVSTGLSLTFGDWVIDGVLNQDVLYTGSFLVSGVAESLFGQVSATMGF